MLEILKTLSILVYKYNYFSLTEFSNRVFSNTNVLLFKCFLFEQLFHAVALKKYLRRDSKSKSFEYLQRETKVRTAVRITAFLAKR